MNGNIARPARAVPRAAPLGPRYNQLSFQECGVREGKRGRDVDARGAYRLTRLAGVPYLLPYGQAIANHLRAVRLGDEGVQAWEVLEASPTVDAFLNTMVRQTGDDSAEARQNYLSFANALSAMGVLSQREEPASPVAQAVLEIAGLRVGFAGRCDLLSRAFDAYRVPVSDPCDQLLTIACVEPPAFVGAQVVVQTKELVVLEREDSWVLNFRQNARLLGAEVAKSGRSGRFYVANGPDDDALAEDLFHAIRFAFLVLAQQRDRYVLHSCSVGYKERALLFSGSSGTGKSTHAALWTREFATPPLNGDLNVLYLSETGEARVCGLPWCGTSGVSERFDLPCAGVVLLRQAPRNQVQDLSRDERQLFLMNRLISPTWNEGLLERCLAFAGAYAQATQVCRYLATRDATSAHVLRAQVDAWLESEKDA